MKKIILIAAITLCSGAAHAANWFILKGAYTDKMVGFFDADTVVKNGATVTIWAKFVQEENSPDVDGSYSTAQRLAYSCKKRTVQLLTQTTYDKSHQFMSTKPTPSLESDIIPDSIGETILKEVCRVDFPKNATPVLNNDIYGFTTTYFNYVNSQKNDPAPLSANWYVFTEAANDSTITFFDPGSITKNGDSITAWLKYFNEPNTPDPDGSYSSTLKEEFFCNKSSVQVLRYSTYDKDGKFMSTVTASSPEINVEPNSVGGRIFKAVCSPDFPTNSQSSLYNPIAGSDAYTAAKKYFDYLKSKKSDPAPM